MSLHTVGSDAKYMLPASYDSVPSAWLSNKAPRPVNCSVQTVNIPALSSNANALGSSILQLPCGPNSGYACNMYLRYDVTVTGVNVANSVVNFKGPTAACTAVINRMSSYIGSQQIDSISSFSETADQLFAHSTSNDWLSRDATVLMGCGVTYDGNAIDVSPTKSFVVPLIGALAGPAVPLFLLNGTLQIQLDYNSVARTFVSTVANANITNFTVSNVQLVYDKISVEDSFVQRVKADMAAGNKYVMGYTNFQSTTLIPTPNGLSSLNYGINVSSLRAVVASQCLTSSLIATTMLANGWSINNDLTQFQVSLDGRLLNNNTLNSVTSRAVCFAELNKCYSRLFDASITDACDSATYLTRYFMVGASAQRTNEALAFAGSPASIVGVNVQIGGLATTMFLTFIADMQLTIDASGQIELIR